LLLQVFYSVRSERLLMQQLNYNLLFRWFVSPHPAELRQGVVGQYDLLRLFELREVSFLGIDALPSQIKTAAMQFVHHQLSISGAVLNNQGTQRLSCGK
jgi:hypothetical protein